MRVALVQCSSRLVGGSGINGSKRTCMSKSQIKTIFITFFDIRGAVHFEFISQGQRVNQLFNVAILKQLHEVVHRKRPQL
jgi:hypothetical protein